MPNTDPRLPMYFGRSSTGTRKLMSKNAPGGTPAPPMPVITLPTIKAFEDEDVDDDDPFRGVVLVDAAKGELEYAERQ
jgi:hypothetical protein